MKAYYLSVEGRDESGGVIVFAENYKQAIGNWNCELEYERWIDRRCKRAPKFDGMENATHYEMMLKQWHEGWWFDTEVRCPWEGRQLMKTLKNGMKRSTKMTGTIISRTIITISIIVAAVIWHWINKKSGDD